MFDPHVLEAEQDLDRSWSAEDMGRLWRDEGIAAGKHVNYSMSAPGVSSPRMWEMTYTISKPGGEFHDVQLMGPWPWLTEIAVGLSPTAHWWKNQASWKGGTLKLEDEDYDQSCKYTPLPPPPDKPKVLKADCVAVAPTVPAGGRRASAVRTSPSLT